MVHVVICEGQHPTPLSEITLSQKKAYVKWVLMSSKAIKSLFSIFHIFLYSLPHCVVLPAVCDIIHCAYHTVILVSREEMGLKITTILLTVANGVSYMSGLVTSILQIITYLILTNQEWN